MDEQAWEENTVQKMEGISAYGVRPHVALDGVVVTGEAVRRVSPESAEFLIEISATAPSAAQALRDNHAKTTQSAQALASLGGHLAELHTISFSVHNMYAPLMQAPPLIQSLPGYGGVQPSQIGAVGFAGAQTAPMQPEPQFNPYELQFGAYHVKNTFRVLVRDAGRAGEAVDALVKSGALILGGFTLRANDDSAARRAAVEAAAKDARNKAEALASASGRKLGDPIAICEDVVASNGTYMALRAAAPFAFGAGAPQITGELEYYARVSARFSFQ